MLAFDLFVTGHVVSGAVGIATFWVPVLGRKGAHNHRRFGRIFTHCMLITGAFAIGISTCTLVDPMSPHTHAAFDDVAMVRGIFGWMMLYLAILTINLAWYGLLCVRNRREHARNRHWVNLLLQGLLLVAATNCAVRGLLLMQPLMLGISTIGFAAVATNLWFIFTPQPGPDAWQKEHLKGLIGAGISVYTAFLAFGAVRMLPDFALNPLVWAMPCTLGVAYIIYQRYRIAQRRRLHLPRPAAPGMALRT